MSYVTSYITDETSWTTDYQALMKEFDDIKEKWISVMEKQGLPIECCNAMNFNRLVSLANWCWRCMCASPYFIYYYYYLSHREMHLQSFPHISP